MAFSNAALKTMLDHEGSVGLLMPWMSLHTDDPGELGAFELLTTLGSPLYGRKAATFSVVTLGQPLNLLNSPVFDVYPVTTVTYLGLWDSQTGGILKTSALLNPALQFNIQDTCTISDADFEILAGD